MKTTKRMMIFALFVMTAIGIGAHPASAQVAGSLTPPLPTTIIDAATANAANGIIKLRPYGAVTIEIKGTFAATVEFNCAMSGTDWKPVKMVNFATGAEATSATAPGIFFVAIPGVDKFQAKVSNYVSGSVTVIAKPVPSVARRVGSGTTNASDLASGNLNIDRMPTGGTWPLLSELKINGTTRLGNAPTSTPIPFLADTYNVGIISEVDQSFTGNGYHPGFFASTRYVPTVNGTTTAIAGGLGAASIDGDKNFGGSLTGLYGTAIANTTGNLTHALGYPLRGVFAYPYNASSPSLSGLMGFQSFAESDTGNVAKVYGYASEAGIYGGTVDKLYHYYAKNADYSGGAGNEQYGVYVEALSGASLNYAIWTHGSAPSYFGGPVRIGGGTAIAKHLSATASLDFDAWAGGDCQNLTVTVTGAADSDVASIGVPTALASVAGVLFSAFVSAANTVTVRGCKVTSGASSDPAAATVRADVWQH